MGVTGAGLGLDLDRCGRSGGCALGRPGAVLAARGGLVSGLSYGWGTESISGMQSSDECVDSDDRPPRLPDQLLQIIDIGLKVGSESRRR